MTTQLLQDLHIFIMNGNPDRALELAQIIWR